MLEQYWIYILLVVLAIVVVMNAVKAVPQGMEYTVEQFGRYTKTLKPGLTLIIPFIEKIGYKMNMRERSKRDEINAKLLGVIDQATDPWGTKVTRIEIKDLSPPADITQAMNAAFLDAEGREREAEAEARATAMVSAAIAKGDVNAVNYFIAQDYVKAFGELAKSPNQKTVRVYVWQ